MQHLPSRSRDPAVAVTHGAELTRYAFGDGHPFSVDRLDAFWTAMRLRGLVDRVEVVAPSRASRADIETFHEPRYVDLVVERSRTGGGYLDYGDTPAFPGAFDAASWVVGSTLDAVDRVLAGRCTRAMVPIAGLHHARRASAGGFCVFNDCAIAIELLRLRHGIERIAYVDIDAHHGDGVYFGFDDDPGVVIGDIHEDGRYLYPGTGSSLDRGAGDAVGSKLNIPIPPGADDGAFAAAWDRVEAHIDAAEPEFVILQCGADGLAGDPLAHLRLTVASHRRAALAVCRLADRHCGGRVLALGGGGYDRRGIGDAWCTIVETMLDCSPDEPSARR